MKRWLDFLGRSASGPGRDHRATPSITALLKTGGWGFRQNFLGRMGLSFVAFQCTCLETLPELREEPLVTRWRGRYFVARRDDLLPAPEFWMYWLSTWFRRTCPLELLLLLKKDPQTTQKGNEWIQIFLLPRILLRLSFRTTNKYRFRWTYQ